MESVSNSRTSDAYPEMPEINRSILSARLQNKSPPIMRSQLGTKDAPGKNIKVQLNVDLEGLNYVAADE